MDTASNPNSDTSSTPPHAHLNDIMFSNTHCFEVMSLSSSSSIPESSLSLTPPRSRSNSSNSNLNCNHSHSLDNQRNKFNLQWDSYTSTGNESIYNGITGNTFPNHLFQYHPFTSLNILNNSSNNNNIYKNKNKNKNRNKNTSPSLDKFNNDISTISTPLHQVFSTNNKNTKNYKNSNKNHINPRKITKNKNETSSNNGRICNNFGGIMSDQKKANMWKRSLYCMYNDNIKPFNPDIADFGNLNMSHNINSMNYDHDSSSYDCDAFGLYDYNYNYDSSSMSNDANNINRKQQTPSSSSSEWISTDICTEASPNGGHDVKFISNRNSSNDFASSFYYYWDCGVWTKSIKHGLIDPRISYWDKTSWLTIRPNLVVIAPTSITNTLMLSRMSPELSKIGTETLRHKLNYPNARSLSKFSSKKGNLQGLYHFEAKYFQYSILQHQVRFVKDLSQNKEYLIFKFGHSIYSNPNHNDNDNDNDNDENKECKTTTTSTSTSSDSDSDLRLYGVCEMNNRFGDGAQPWHCRSIMTLDEMVAYFGIPNGKSNAGSTEAVVAEQVPDSLCLEKAQNKFKKILSMSPLKSSRNDDIMQYNNKFGFKVNLRELKSKLFRGFEEHDLKIQQQRQSQGNGNKKTKTRSRNNTETKYDYLDKISRMMGIDRIELLNCKLGPAIKNAFEFARKYPSTVLTQVFICETERQVGYELVLLAEIPDTKNKKFYKFGVPIAKHENEKSKKQSNSHDYYIAKTVLTPFMANNNVRLYFAGHENGTGNENNGNNENNNNNININCECSKGCNGCKNDKNNRNDKNKFGNNGNWLDTICDNNVSFYKQIDASWRHCGSK